MDVALVAASPPMDRDSLLPPSLWGLACTIDPHPPTHPMGLRRPEAGVWSPFAFAVCLLQQNLWVGGGGLDPAQCPTSSWAAGLREL